MSGRQEKAVPVSLTQQEVDALIKGGKPAATVRRRLRLAGSTKVTSAKLRTDKICPQPISRKEMAAIVRLRVPSSVRERIVSSSPSPIGAEGSSSTDKAAPTATPQKQKYARK
jgi:hypothetical protein